MQNVWADLFGRHSAPPRPQDCQPIAARLRGGFNARDDKLRQYFYRGKVEEYTALFGEEEGRTMAAISTGPISEAYVGGGS